MRQLVNFAKGASAAFALCIATEMALSAQTFETLFTFNLTDGSSPQPLVQGTDGNFYGTTQFGGSNSTCMEGGTAIGCGTVFRITSGGTLTTLHNFDGIDGFLPFGSWCLPRMGDSTGQLWRAEPTVAAC